MKEEHRDKLSIKLNLIVIKETYRNLPRPPKSNGVDVLLIRKVCNFSDPLAERAMQ